MKKINEPPFHIYFGDKTDNIFPADIKKTNSNFNVIKEKLNLKNLVILKQVHGTKSVCVDEQFLKENSDYFSKEGDTLLTNIKNIGIGVLTADCVPIVLFDKKNKACSVVHAGWSGTKLRAVQKACDEMQNKYKSNIKDITAYIGPSARACCYEVQPEFIKNFENFLYKDQIFIHKKNKIYFDVSRCNELQLREIGLSEKNIVSCHNHCTICTPRFFSYRRQGKDAGRQVTIVFTCKKEERTC